MLRGIRDEGDVTRKFMEARCDRGAEIARMLFLSEQTAAAIRSLDEHWDGRGMPDGLRGEEIPLAARILCLAQTVQVFARVIDAKSPFTAELADLAANHHEKLDGSGYPLLARRRRPRPPNAGSGGGRHIRGPHRRPPVPCSPPSPSRHSG